METELQRTKEENLSLITATKLLSANSSENLKRADDNNSSSSNWTITTDHVQATPESSPLEIRNRFDILQNYEIAEDTSENQALQNPVGDQIEDYRSRQKKKYKENQSALTR